LFGQNGFLEFLERAVDEKSNVEDKNEYNKKQIPMKKGYLGHIN